MRLARFDAQDENIRESVRKILYEEPVQHLTEDEVLATIRLMQLEIALQDSPRSQYAVTVYRDDERLRHLPDSDKFMAALLDSYHRDDLLGYKKLCYCFGGTKYQWRKVVQACPIIEDQSRTVEGQYGGRFLGRGWVLAPHIRTLRSWIIANSTKEEFKNLRS